MSSAVISTTAALGRPFVFDEEVNEARPLSGAHRKPAGKQEPPQSSAIARAIQSTIKNQQATIPLVTPASRLEIRPAPEMVSSGISALDVLTGGLPRGCLTEICGPASSGRTTLLLAALAAATRRGEFCAVVDASDALDPQSVGAAGVELDRLLWVRCGGTNSLRKNLSPQRHRGTEETVFEINSGKRIGSESRKYPSLHAFSINNQKSAIKNSPNRQSEIGDRKFHGSESEHCLEQVLRATDLLLEGGGFGLIVLDLGDLSSQAACRIPLTTWFRFRRAIEHTPTILLAIEQQPIAGSCSSLLLQLGVPGTQYLVPSSENMRPAHAHLLTGVEIKVELVRSRLERKPARSVTFTTKTAWAG